MNWDGMGSLNWNGCKGEIGLLRTEKLLRWCCDAAEGDAVDWDGMGSLNSNGDKGEIGHLRTGELLRWRR